HVDAATRAMERRVDSDLAAVRREHGLPGYADMRTPPVRAGRGIDPGRRDQADAAASLVGDDRPPRRPRGRGCVAGEQPDVAAVEPGLVDRARTTERARVAAGCADP